MEAALAANGPRHNRHHIAHVQAAPALPHVPRFRRLGVTVNAQPLWARLEPQMTRLTLPFLGPDRGGWQYLFGDFENAGAATAFGSDWPVSTPDPFRELHVAVNRTPVPDKTSWSPADGVFLPEQRLSLLSAIRAFTLGSAYVNHAEDVAGGWRQASPPTSSSCPATRSTGHPGISGAPRCCRPGSRGGTVYQREPAA